MKSVAIIGFGFSGLMTAVHLIRSLKPKTTIIIIDKKETFGKGIAYSPYSDKLLLNVPAGKMSAFTDQPDHFAQWLTRHPDFSTVDKAILSHAFVPRHYYGSYLEDIWHHCHKECIENQLFLREFNTYVKDIVPQGNMWEIYLENGAMLTVDQCILSTGNQPPELPFEIADTIQSDSRVYRNPWNRSFMDDLDKTKPLGIIGNGLSMVDILLALKENGFPEKIFSISRYGERLIPYLPSAFPIGTFDLQGKEGEKSLLELLSEFNKIRHRLKSLGLSSDILVDEYRSFTGVIWENLSMTEKRSFLSRLRPFWDPLRHRLPLNSYLDIQAMRKSNQWVPLAAKIHGIEFIDGYQLIHYSTNEQMETAKLKTGAIVVCTGPGLYKFRPDAVTFIERIIGKGIVKPDEFGLGLCTDESKHRLTDISGQEYTNLYSLGPVIKGRLWESTAVREIRDQAKNLAAMIAKDHF